MYRLLTPIFWVSGMALLFAAFIMPFLEQYFLIHNIQADAEQIVDQIASLENNLFQTQNLYLTFSKGEVPDPIHQILQKKSAITDSFVFDAYLHGNHHLIIRATTSDQKLLSGDLPLMIFVYKKQLRTHETTQEWIEMP